jgi:acetolactate synthase-1/2/3 large subunit
MVMQELATSVAEDIPVTIVLLNNGWLGMVRQWQKLFWEKKYSGTRLQADPDFVKLAESFGACGIRVEKSGEVGDALKQAMDSDTTCIVDIHTNPEEDICPMILADPKVPIVKGRCTY